MTREPFTVSQKPRSPQIVIASSLLSLLLYSLPASTANAVTGHGPRSLEIRTAIILPAETNFITSLSKVLPVLDIAVRDLYATGVLREAEVKFKFMAKDDKCEDIEAIRCSFDLIVNGRVDLFLGPTCDYGVDLVARMIKFWNAPLLTTGGVTNDFSYPKTDPKSKYFLLVRTGTLHYQGIADVVVSILNRYLWKNVLLINENDSYPEVSGKQSCGLMTKTLMEMFMRNDTNVNITYDVFDLSKNKHNGMKENLRNEAGSKHAITDFGNAAVKKLENFTLGLRCR